MEFKSHKAIYLQIADLICNDILAGRYPEDTRLPSVREYAAQVEVNVNTVARSFEWLQQHDILSVRRGLGNYVATGAKRGIGEVRRQEFFSEQLPELFTNMQTLGITIQDVVEQYHQTQS
ncbi:MAG: GntR family transcriptional regulator [Bacteroidales bacterium]|nr:GntR family transcriptional regulator [Bacteroidales bacterium]